MPQAGPKMAQRGRKMAPRWTKMAPRWPQDGPRWPTIGPQQAPSWPQDGPRWPKDGQTWPQIAPRWHQDGPTWPKIAPRWPQNGPEKAQHDPQTALARWRDLPQAAGYICMLPPPKPTKNDPSHTKKCTGPRREHIFSKNVRFALARCSFSKDREFCVDETFISCQKT